MNEYTAPLSVNLSNIRLSSKATRIFLLSKVHKTNKTKQFLGISTYVPNL